MMAGNVRNLGFGALVPSVSRDKLLCSGHSGHAGTQLSLDQSNCRSPAISASLPLAADPNLLTTDLSLCIVFPAHPCDRKSHGRSTVHAQGPHCRAEYSGGSPSPEAFSYPPVQHTQVNFRPSEVRSLS